jgi:hypothetical protein
MKSIKIEFRGCANVFDKFVKVKNNATVDLLPRTRIEGLIYYLLGHSLPVYEIKRLAPKEGDLVNSILDKMIVGNVRIKDHASCASFGQGKLINRTRSQNQSSGSAPFHLTEDVLSDKMREYWGVVKEMFPNIGLNNIDEKGEGGIASFQYGFSWPSGVSKSGVLYESYQRCLGLRNEDKIKDYPEIFGKVNAEIFNRIFKEGSPENILYKHDPKYFPKTYFINGSRWVGGVPNANRIIVRGSMALKLHFDFDIFLNDLSEDEFSRIVNGPMIGLYSEGSAVVSICETVDDLVDERDLLIVPDNFKRVS